MWDINMDEYQTYGDAFVYKTKEPHGEYMPGGDQARGGEQKGGGRVEQEGKGEST